MLDHSSPHNASLPPLPVTSSGQPYQPVAGGPVSAALDISPFAELLLNPNLSARRMTVPADRVLYEPNSDAKSLFFVHRGQVRTYRTDSATNGRLIDILGPEDWCGEGALSRQAHYGERAVATVASVVTEVPVDRLMSVMAQSPKTAIEMVRQLSSKLSAARTEAAGLVFDDCHSRLLKTLVRFSNSAAASPHPDGVQLRITHHQLAQAVGVARETVSLALTEFRQQNLLRTGRNQLTFNPENLRAFERKQRSESQDTLANGK